jgi:hypothetical protein
VPVLPFSVTVYGRITVEQIVVAETDEDAVAQFIPSEEYAVNPFPEESVPPAIH